MKGYVIIKDGRNIKEVENVKGFIEMSIRKSFDKLDCQLVEDEMFTVIFGVKTSKKRFNLIEEHLDRLNPKGYVFLKAKGL